MNYYTYEAFPKWIYFENGAKTLVRDENELAQYKMYSNSPKGPFPKVKEIKESPIAEIDPQEFIKKPKGRKPKNDG